MDSPRRQGAHHPQRGTCRRAHEAARRIRRTPHAGRHRDDEARHRRPRRRQGFEDREVGLRVRVGVSSRSWRAEFQHPFSNSKLQLDFLQLHRRCPPRRAYRHSWSQWRGQDHAPQASDRTTPADRGFGHHRNERPDDVPRSAPERDESRANRRREHREGPRRGDRRRREETRLLVPFRLSLLARTRAHAGEGAFRRRTRASHARETLLEASESARDGRADQ